MNFDRILEKPFLVTTVKWSTTDNNFTELWRLPFPSCIMSNPLAKVPFNSATFYQAKMCCMLQVSGTPMHQGLILVAAVPHGTPAITNPNQLLSAPHVFLNATESTSVCLECPMYTPSTLYKTQDPNTTVNDLVVSTSRFGTDVFDLVFFVMDALTVAVGSSTTVSLSVHTLFKEAEFYVPKVGLMSWQPQCGVRKMWSVKSKASVTTECACGKKELFEDRQDSYFSAEGLLNNLWRLPTKILDNAASGLKVVSGDLIDYGRSMLKELTGFHNPNVPSIDNKMIATFRNFPNNVDQPVRLEVLDNHAQFSRIYDDFYFRTEQDEMDLKFLTSKPVYVGKFTVSSTTETGKNLFAYPMTPMVEATVLGGNANTTFYSPMRTIYEASRYWRGDLKLHIQAVCTNFHFCKIIVLKNYAMTDAPIHPSTAYAPAYNDIHNINTDTLEFSAGGQIQTIDLKYNSNLRQLECTKDYVANAVNHGIAYGYLVQPLTYNSNVPTSITFNVYISGGNDLQFSGYALDPVDVEPGISPVYPGVPSSESNELGVYEVLNDDLHTGRILNKNDVKRQYLEQRRIKFLESGLDEYIVEDGDEWEDVAFITGIPLETLRNLNFDTHNKDSKHYSLVKGPLLSKGERLKIKKFDSPTDVNFLNSLADIDAMNIPNFKPEGMEVVEGVNTLVTPNSQNELLNDEIPCDESVKMSFRPNTSVRDYLRFMYPQETLIYTPVGSKSVVAYDVHRLINKFTKADYFHAISSLYMGISGGFKLKFKISGVTCASATYVPPSYCCHNVSGVAPIRFRPMSNRLPTDLNAETDFLNGMTYNPNTKSFTAPQIEMQDYTRPYNNAGTDLAGKPGSTFVLEMAIPNMNQFNFVGNAAKWFNLQQTPDVENDLGVIYLNLEASTTGSTRAQVHIIPFIGINDETRLGFQVYAPQKSIPTFTASSPANVCRSSMLHPFKAGSTYPNGIPVTLMPITGSSYYFNSV